MKLVSEQTFDILNKLLIKKADVIMEGCKLYHFYFHDTKTSFSYTKDDILKLMSV